MVREDRRRAVSPHATGGRRACDCAAHRRPGERAAGYRLAGEGHRRGDRDRRVARHTVAVGDRQLGCRAGQRARRPRVRSSPRGETRRRQTLHSCKVVGQRKGRVARHARAVGDRDARGGGRQRPAGVCARSRARHQAVSREVAVHDRASRGHVGGVGDISQRLDCVQLGLVGSQEAGRGRSQNRAVGLHVGADCEAQVGARGRRTHNVRQVVGAHVVRRVAARGGDAQCRARGRRIDVVRKRPGEGGEVSRRECIAARGVDQLVRRDRDTGQRRERRVERLVRAGGERADELEARPIVQQQHERAGGDVASDERAAVIGDDALRAEAVHVDRGRARVGVVREQADEVAHGIRRPRADRIVGRRVGVGRAAVGDAAELHAPRGDLRHHRTRAVVERGRELALRPVHRRRRAGVGSCSRAPRFDAYDHVSAPGFRIELGGVVTGRCPRSRRTLRPALRRPCQSRDRRHQGRWSCCMRSASASSRLPQPCAGHGPAWSD